MISRRKFLKSSALSAGVLLGTTLSAEVPSADEAKMLNEEPANPFKHGVASGDPLSTQIIIWTKLSPSVNAPLSVRWAIAKDENFSLIVQSGETKTSADIDYTVKVDVENLTLSSVFFYRFESGGFVSPVGRTRTTNLADGESVQLAVVSCTNYSAGYYTAFSKIAAKTNLNAVIHLGDYIYEGTERSFDPANAVPDDDFESTHFNRTKAWWLHYYRKRYALSHLDPDLQAAHRAHPFITIWDDHEFANNAWKDGAQGHNPETDEDWETRKSAAKQAYAEWMPIRGNASKIYRSVKYGSLAEIILLDTRVEGRDKQIYDVTSPELFSKERTLLGKDQKRWMFQKLAAASTQWKVLANQVIFSEIDVKWAYTGGTFTDKVNQLQNTLLDYWEGYPAERDECIDYISRNKINDVIILSASMHCALAFDVTKRATARSRKNEKSTYDPGTGNGSVAVEFAAASVTSENFDEKMGSFYAATFQSLINRKLPPPLSYNPNPHLKFADLQQHGYFILNLTKAKAQAEFYSVNIHTKGSKEQLITTLQTLKGSNKLSRAAAR